MCTSQVLAVPEHAPPQPAKTAPPAGVSVSVTLASFVSFALQVVSPLPQEMPPPATEPFPLTETASVGWVGVPPENEAVTDLAAVIVTAQLVCVPCAEQAAPQPVNVAPFAGDSVSVTVEPAVSSFEQVDWPLPQLIPPPVTVPLPVTETSSGYVVAPPPPPAKVA